MQPAYYMAYMLRMWESANGTQAIWRASLESPHTGERQVFPDLDTLFAYLRQQASSLADEAQWPDPGSIQAEPPARAEEQ